AVLSDHGEGLGDHGEATHGVFLYDATIHVPLLLRLPQGRGARRISTRVSLADVAPTILDAGGVAGPPAMPGRTLPGPGLAGDAEVDRPSYGESEYPRRVFGWSSLASWRAERFLFVEAPRPELYDLRADPQARRNLVHDRPAAARGLAAQMEAARRSWAGGA